MITEISMPTVFSQLITEIILAAGRIFGEVAALIYTAELTKPLLNTAAPIDTLVNP